MSNMSLRKRILVSLVFFGFLIHYWLLSRSQGLVWFVCSMKHGQSSRFARKSVWNCKTHQLKCCCEQCENYIRVRNLAVTCLSSIGTSGEQKDDVRVVYWISFLVKTPPVTVLGQTFCFSGHKTFCLKDRVRFVCKKKLSCFSPV